MAREQQRPSPPDQPPSATIAAILAWLLPGLGHWWIGERARGAILFIVLTVTFWGGVAVGGVRSTIAARDNGAWIAAQICAGPQALGALYLGSQLRARTDADMFKAAWPASNIGVVYAGIAGMLNILVIIDVIARAERARTSIAARDQVVIGQKGAAR